MFKPESWNGPVVMLKVSAEEYCWVAYIEIDMTGSMI